MNSKWKGTSVTFDKANNILFDILKKEGILLRENDDGFTLENQSNYFIYENEFIEASTNLLSIVTKYTQKEYSGKSKVFWTKENTFENIQANFSDSCKYLNIVRNNIIDGDIRELDISINVLNSILNESRKSRLFLDILIMFALGTRVRYDAEDVNVEFYVDDAYYNFNINIKKSDFLNLYPIYDWIFNDEEYKDSYIVKLQIVRHVIIKKRDISDISNIIIDSKLAYKRIISKKTDDYFNQLTQLKEDFLVLAKHENSVLRTLNITFFAWLGYLGVELFKIIVNYSKPDIVNYLLFSTGAKKGLVIIGFIVALSLIFLGYILEVKSLEKTYNVLKNLYEDKILFDNQSDKNGKFDNTITKPEVGWVQKCIFVIILILLFIRFYMTFPW